MGLLFIYELICVLLIHTFVDEIIHLFMHGFLLWNLYPNNHIRIERIN